jgi:linoleoyl-CoA desaturase
MDEAQKWNPYYLGNPLYAFLLMLGFEWGVMLHDLEAERVVAGEKSLAEVKPLALQWWNKAGKQVLKDYVLFPALTGPLFVNTLAANATANVVRNIWAYSIIFCGHFPTGVATFTEQETENESRGRWYLRQMLGSANITGSSLFHVMTGNLSFQIEHHLFPDLPARRYAEIAPEVRALCAKYGLPYNAGRLSKQLGSVYGKIARLALPSLRRNRPEPEPAIRIVAADAITTAA